MLSSLELRLAFNKLPGVGAGKYWACVEHFGSIEAAIEDGFSELVASLSEDAAPMLRELVERQKASRLYKLVAAEQERAEQLGFSLIADNDACYPPLLRETKRCPSVLYVQGNVSALSLPQIAIVGSRSPSPIGQELAFEFAQQLADAGFSITSGLALGIDACAHRGALSTSMQEASTTIAVLGSALNRRYPRRNLKLADEIVRSGGAIVSEFPLDTEARPEHFPQRNRIVSGLACGTLVVEAALKSGSLITARCALQQDREVFAIPGSIRSSVSKGCNAMIKSGAKLVETPMDVICELESLVAYQRGVTSINSPQTDAGIAEQGENSILAAVGYEATSLDQIADRVLVPYEQLLPSLLQLELEGRIENTGLGYIRL